MNRLSFCLLTTALWLTVSASADDLWKTPFNQAFDQAKKQTKVRVIKFSTRW